MDRNVPTCDLAPHLSDKTTFGWLSAGRLRMLIHDRFIFLHVPKTGGMFLRDVLKRELPPGTVRDEREEPQVHAGRQDIPEALKGRPVLAYVRNPWDWYVSAYHFMTNPSIAPPPDPIDARIVDALLGGYTYDFAEMMRAACGNGDLGFSESEVSEMVEHGALRVQLLFEGYDYYTSLVLGQIGTEPFDAALTIGRFETLVDDLEQFFAKEEIVVADGAFSRIRAAEPINTSIHRPYRQYYDDDLRDRVGGSCKMIVERFNYTF
jgi:hypothetical protein